MCIRDRHGTAHVDIDEVRAGVFQCQRRTLRHHRRVVSKNLRAADTCIGFAEQRDALFVLINQGARGDHLRYGDVRAERSCNAAVCPVGHARHRGQHDGIFDLKCSELHARAFFPVGVVLSIIPQTGKKRNKAATAPTDPIAAHKKRHPDGWRFFMERGTGILRRLCRLRAVSAIVLTFGQNRRYFIPLPVLRPELPDGRTTGSLRDPCSKNQHPSKRWVLIFGKLHQLRYQRFF